MSINFTTNIEAAITSSADEMTIRLREKITVPDPEPSPDPVPTPAPWAYPVITAHVTYGPENITTIMALLESAVFPGTIPAGSQAVVKLRAGIYNFPRTVYPKLKGPPAGVLFVAEHGAQVVFNFNTSTGHGLFFTGAAYPERIWFRRIRFTDLRTTSGQGGFQLIKFDISRALRFYECEFDNSRASGIYSNAGATDTLYFGCIYRDNGFSSQFDHGLYTHSSEGLLTINRCFFVNNASHGIHAFDGGAVGPEFIRNISVFDSIFLSFGEPQDRPMIFQDDSPSGTTVNAINVSGCVYFNAYPTEDPTEKSRNSITFTRPVLCTLRGCLTWNVPIVAGPGLAQTDNVEVPPVKDALYVKFFDLDPAAGRYAITIFNYAQLTSVLVPLPDLPSGRYSLEHVAAPIGTTPVIFDHFQGDTLTVDMTRAYSQPQTRAGGFNFGTTKAAAAFRIIRIPTS